VATTQMFLRIDTVRGDSTDVKFRDWFDLISEEAVDSTPQTPTDPSRLVVTGRRSHKPFSILKLDVGVAGGFSGLAGMGQGGKRKSLGGEIAVVENGIVKHRLTLSEITIMSCSTGGGAAGGGKLTAQITMSCGIQEEAIAYPASISTIPGRSARVG